MRKITEQAALAFANAWEFGKSNTMVTVEHVDGVEQTKLFLHGNLIASMMNGELMMTLAGWPTPTTRERLNGLLVVLGRPEGFWQSKHHQWFGTLDTNRGIEDAEWVRVDLLREAV